MSVHGMRNGSHYLQCYYSLLEIEHQTQMAKTQLGNY